MTKLQDVSRAPLMKRQWCYTHGKYCELFAADKASELDVSGLPCPDFSAAGLRRREEGPTATVFMAHAKRHKELETPLIVVENVKDWPAAARDRVLDA